jgi:membrane-associated phospholipid phosphatase
VLALLDPLVHLDQRIQRAVQSLRPSPLDPVMRVATDVGRPEIVLGVLLAVAVASVPAGPATARNAILALLPTNLVVEGVKRAVNRTRPDGERKRSNASFPSSHAANAFALALVFSRRWRRLAVALFACAAFVALSRVYLNRHFASDILAGAAVGVGCSWAALRYLQWPSLDRAKPSARGPRS